MNAIVHGGCGLLAERWKGLQHPFLYAIRNYVDHGDDMRADQIMVVVLTAFSERSVIRNLVF